MKRKTNVMVQIIWDDEVEDHPAGWDLKTMLEGDPFTNQGTTNVRMLSFEDVDEEGNPEQI